MQNDFELLEFLNSMTEDSSVEELEASLGYSKELAEGDYMFELKGVEHFHSKYTDKNTQIEHTKTNIKFVGVVKSIPEMAVNELTGETIVKKESKVLNDEYIITPDYFETNPTLEQIKRFASITLYQLKDNKVTIDPARQQQLYSKIEKYKTIGDTRRYGKMLKDHDLFIAEKLEGLAPVLNNVVVRNIAENTNPIFRLSIVKSVSKAGKTYTNKHLSRFSDIKKKSLL